MKEYKRLTEKRETPLVMSMWGGTSQELRIYNRLAEFENDLESGKLVRLPCKVGDKAYLVHSETQRYPFEFVVEDVRYMKGSWYVDSSTYGGKIGKYVFLTKSEAEARLREIQGEK